MQTDKYLSRKHTNTHTILHVKRKDRQCAVWPPSDRGLPLMARQQAACLVLSPVTYCSALQLLPSSPNRHTFYLTILMYLCETKYV